jgi:four helix bundle protein
MKKNIIKDKSFHFAVRIVKLCKILMHDKKEYIMAKQLMRSGTAVGALYREAEQAESKKDFIHKLAIAQKECNESMYWLELLYATDYLTKPAFESIFEDAKELIKLLTSIIKTTKKNINE